MRTRNLKELVEPVHPSQKGRQVHVLGAQSMTSLAFMIGLFLYQLE